MTLKQLLEKVEYELQQGGTDIEISGIVYNSRKVTKGCVFPCIRGAVFDGHAFASEVAGKGAAAIVAEEKVDVPEGVTVVIVADTRVAMARMAAAWFGYPARKMKTIGITGTKGKTTTSYMVKDMLETAGIKTGLVGTIETLIDGERIPSANTTPESVVLQEYLARMAEAGCQAVVMEVSSQALMQHRVEGITFDIGVFTNISPDHIGPAEHASFEEYMDYKSRLFQMCRMGIFNGDDIHLGRILEGHTCEVETYGLSPENQLYAQNIRLVSRPGYLGTSFEVMGSLHFKAETDIPGKFSVYNALCAIAICRHFGLEKELIKEALAGVKVRGRAEMVKVSDDFTLLIDYAHNAMALESLLSALRKYHPARLVTVFGCGGNRARSRRYEMGEISGRCSDFTIITSDNPRYEDPEAIMDDIEKGIQRTDGKYVRITDRKEAIRAAIRGGKPGDVIVLAGKGHEDYQEICGKKYPMDERELIAEILAEEKH